MTSFRYQTFRGNLVDNAPLMGLSAATSIVITAAREQAGTRIESSFPAWKQRNLLAEAGALTNSLAKGRPHNAGEQSRSDELSSVWDWVSSVRAASNTIEAEVLAIAAGVGTELEKTENILDMDIENHAAWPGPPPVAS